MIGGWFVGNFEPSAYKTKNAEIAVHHHKTGDKWPAHYHAIATEISFLLKGKMKFGDIELNEGDIVVIEPNEIATPVFLEDCIIVVVKTPSVPGDKHVVHIT